MADISTLTRRYVNSKRRLGQFAPKTAVTYKYALDAFVDHIGDRPIENVTRRHVERYIETRRAASTKQHQLSLVRNFFVWCVDSGHLAKNPAAGMRGPKIRRSLPRALATPDVQSIFDACPDTRGRLMILLAVQEGLRCHEVSGLLREDIDLGSLLLTVMGKGNKERVLPISDETARVMFDYLAEAPGPSGPLIRSTVLPEKGISAQYVSKLLISWMAEAGVKRAPYDGRSGHSLRHTCATALADQGVDLRVIADVLGHAATSTTEIYTRRAKAHGPLREAMAGRTYLAGLADTA